MDILIKAAQLVLSLSILVVLHEFGHFIPARLFKTRVEKFYLFFNPWFSLFKKKVGETEWGIGWLPLGGYVKISGMVDESMDKEQLAQPAQPWEFRSKPAWQRLIIMIGGVVVNLILGFIIFICVVFAFGKVEFKPEELESGLAIHPYFEKFGLKSGDNITRLDGEKFNHYQDFKFKWLDINNEIFLRGVRNLEVQHPNGKKEIVTLPENIDDQIFNNRVAPIFTPRIKNKGVEAIFSIQENKILKIKTGDELIAVNGNATYDDKSLENVKSITVLRDSLRIILNVSKQPIDSVFSCFPALSIGLQKNDKIIEAEGIKIDFTDNLLSVLYENKGKTVNLTIIRGKETINRTLKVSKLGMIGFRYKDLSKEEMKKFKIKYFSFGESIALGFKEGKNNLGDYISQMKFIFTPKGASSVGGFASIGNMFAPQWDWQKFWLNTAFISIVLAFMNILPIPALDGGHVVFLLYEMVTGREAPQKVLEYAQITGFVILMSLLLYANGNDIYRWLTNAF